MADGAQPVVIVDEDGHIVALVLDGSVYRLSGAFKVQDTDGNFVTPAKDSTLLAIKNTDGIKKIVDPLPAGTNNIGDVDVLSSALPTGAATEATLLVADGRLATIDSVLDSIKDTDGIKKITDALPIGDNVLGRVKMVDGEEQEVSIEDAATIPAGHSGIVIAGKDGTTARFAQVDSVGRLVTSPPGSNSVLRGFNNGKVVLAATANVPVRFTTYTEQTSNAQRSIASSSATDTAAGTGARTVRITYYSVSAGVVTGPFYEDVTLNGTSYVNTVSTTIAYVERIEVLTVGSGLTNAGTLTLKAATAGGGATIVTVGIGDGKTFLGMHYVVTGRTMKLTSVACGTKGADAATFTVAVANPTNANSYEKPVSDLVRAGTTQNSIQRSYGTPIEIPGPARVQLYVQPDSTSSRTYFASMDWYED